MTPSPAHPVEVAPARLPGWVERFTASHGAVRWSVLVDEDGAPDAWHAQAADGSWARLEGWGRPEGDFAADGAWVAPPGPLLVVLVRRGGYAVAVTSVEGRLVAHKVGTRHVQSRTAAGGWSQQRFARRRANQADALADAVEGHARRILTEGEAALGEQVGALLVGGDPRLCDQVMDALAAGPLERLNRIPRRELRDLPDPRRTVLDDAVRRALSVRVLVQNA